MALEGKDLFNVTDESTRVESTSLLRNATQMTKKHWPHPTHETYDADMYIKKYHTYEPYIYLSIILFLSIEYLLFIFDLLKLHSTQHTSYRFNSYVGLRRIKMGVHLTIFSLLFTLSHP